MNQFDETTGHKTTVWRLSVRPNVNDLDRDDCFIAGRSSAKESLVEMAQALTQNQSHSFYCPWIARKELNADPHDCNACESIRQVKARGDWPLEDK